MRRSRYGLPALVLVLALLLLAACARPSSPAATAQSPDKSPGEATAADGGFTDDLVVVPDVRGMSLDEASAALRAVGLEPAERLVHGPVEPDAGPMGEVYAQEPDAGGMVRSGTSVTVSRWWERE